MADPLEDIDVGFTVGDNDTLDPLLLDEDDFCMTEEEELAAFG